MRFEEKPVATNLLTSEKPW